MDQGSSKGNKRDKYEGDQGSSKGNKRDKYEGDQGSSKGNKRDTYGGGGGTKTQNFDIGYILILYTVPKMTKFSKPHIIFLKTHPKVSGKIDFFVIFFVIFL